MSKRVKYVYDDNDAIAHLWIGHNISGEGQSEARNPRHNFYFNGTTIYSYGSHFPIATFVKNGKKRAIQFTTRSYSVTTSGHISTVRGAIRGNDISIFHIPNVETLDRERPSIVADYVSRFNAAIVNQSKARATWKIESFHNEAIALKAECQAYCKFWKMKAPKFATIPALPKDFKERQARETEQGEKRREVRKLADDARRKLWEEQNKVQVEKYTAEVNEWNTNIETHIADWLTGGSLNQPNVVFYGYSEDTPKLIAVSTLLRIQGDEIETSRSASFPIEHAKRGLALVEACIGRGEDWHANGHTCKLGLYSISRIEVTPGVNGGATIYAGCHEVPFSSVLRIREEIIAYEPKPAQVEA